MGDQDPLSPAAYAVRVHSEIEAYREKTNLLDLPPIHWYWLRRYILPQFASLGYTSAEEFFQRNIEQAYRRSQVRHRRFLSIGAGNCDAEVPLAAALRQAEATDFTIDCLDLNPHMLERGQALAAAQGLSAHIHGICADFNTWQPSEEYDAVMANQALHHVLRLEHLFDGIQSSLRREGLLVVSDMIGRNGHRRWPEALVLVERFWRELPEPYRYNRQLQRQETGYPDWDCAAEGFEGIRSQDILPLLLDRFRFQFFYAFANVIDPFVDRGFGPNFDGDGEWDRGFVDRVHACDEEEIQAGRVKPTHMLAVLSRDGGGAPICFGHRTPEFCVRRQ